MGGGMSDWTSSHFSEDWDEPEYPLGSLREVSNGFQDLQSRHWLTEQMVCPTL